MKMKFARLLTAPLLGVLISVSPLEADNSTVSGVATAQARSSSQIVVEPSFAGDDNGNGYTVIDISTNGLGSFDYATFKVGGTPLWRIAAMPALPGRDHYVRVTHIDPDGVSGQTAQVLGPITTPTSAPNSTTISTAQVRVRDTEIEVSCNVTNDANLNSSFRVEVGSSASGPWIEKSGPHSARNPKRARVRSLEPGSDYWLRVTINDPDGVVGTNPQVIGPVRYTGAKNLAFNRPVTADQGWGCCPTPAQLTDGRIQYGNWNYGFAWTGGLDHWAGGPEGIKQATVDLGVGATFNHAAVWIHDPQGTPLIWGFDVSDDGVNWTRVYWKTDPICRGLNEPINNDYWADPGCAQEGTFPAVTARYLRYLFDDRQMFNRIHGWVVELEVFRDVDCRAISIFSEPQSQQVSAGTSVNFSVGATGTTPVSYQWRVNGSNLPTANDSVFSLNNVQVTHAGTYSVIVSNCAGSFVSADASLVVLSDTNRVYSIGQIPNTTVWQGDTLEFITTSDLGASATISASVLNSPRGSIIFDPATGRLRYMPDAADKRPFTVRIVASLEGQTRTQDVEITPVPHLPPEQTAFGLTPTHPLPDPDSKDYIVRNETLSESDENFNLQPRRTRTVIIIGKDLVFQRGHPNGLFDSYHDTADIKSLTIYAERVILKNALRLPQTELMVYARQLIFEDGPEAASITTTPRSIPTRAASASGGSPGQSGIDGLKAGDITLNTGRIVANPGPKRFILTGGNGQPAGLGYNGIDGQSATPYAHLVACVDYWAPNPNNTIGVWYKVTTSCSGRYPPRCNSPQPGDRWVSNGGDGFNFKETAWPTSGTDAASAGKPGEPGMGGSIRANLDIANIADLRGGAAGDAAPLPRGGRAGTPSPAYVYYWGCEGGHPIGQRSTTAGRDGVAPSAHSLTGSAGDVQQIGEPTSWLTPHALNMVLAHAKDAYLYGYFATAQSVFSDYDEIITRYSASPEWQSLSPEWQAELTALQSEMQSLLHRLANNLDYFGNPAGWVPMLSFEANFALFQNEIEPAIRTLYLSYWINNAANNLQKKLDGLATARSKLTQEVEEFRDEFSDVQSLMPGLETEFLSLSNNTERVQKYLDQLEQSLATRAQHNVEDRYKVPGWKKGLKTASAIMSVIPAWQPALGAVGQGLNVIADYDSKNPLGSLPGLIETGKQFSGGKLKQSMDSWKTEMDKLSLQNFTTKRITVTNCVTITNCTVTLVNGFPITNCTLTTDCSQRVYSPTEFVKNLQGYGKALQEGYKVYRDLNRETRAPANEIEAELQTLKASDPAFNQAVDEISKLMAQKEIYARKLADAVQTTARLADGITHDLLAIDGVNRDASHGLAVIDVRALTYLKEMERRAKERLLKYHYYLSKAYEYRLLQSYSGELRLDRLFDKFRDIVVAGKGQELGAEDFNALKALYEEQLSSIVEVVVDRFNSSPNEWQQTIPLTVPPEALTKLKPGQPIRINLKEIETFFPSEENLRIADVRVDAGRLGVRFPAGRFPFNLRFAHTGLSRLSSDGESYSFRHYNDHTRSPLRWGGRYNLNGSFSALTPSDYTRSLLYALLSRTGLEDNILLFSRPSVDAEVEVSLESASTNFAITNLDLVLTYDFTERRSDLVTLEVFGDDQDLMPYFILSKADFNARQDGRGAFRRTFRRNDHVSIEAPMHTGSWRFVRWSDNYGNELGTNRLLNLDMSSDVAIRAAYRLVEEPDSDLDGLSDRWEVLFFGSLNPRAEDDPDRDGVSNVQEQLNGSLPGQAGSPPRFVGQTLHNGLLLCTWLSVPGKVYQLQVRDSFDSGWQNYGQPLIAPGDQTSAYIAMTASIRFVRVASSE